MELQNIVEFFYTFIIVLSCAFIYFKTRKIYSLTSHKGIKAFRHAFFYWGFAFLVRYLGIILEPYFQAKFTLSLISGLIFLYGLSMAGFSLVYSLAWKNLKDNKKYILHLVAIVIAVLHIFYIQNLMFYAQFAVLLYGINISYSNYKHDSGKHKFLQLYFIGLILAFIGYFANFISVLIVPYYVSFIFYSYALTSIVFVIFVYGVHKVIK